MVTAEGGCYMVSSAFHAFPRDRSNVIGPYDVYFLTRENTSG